jgi:hypothetical protein
VIEAGHDLAVEDLLEVLEVDHHARHRVRLAAQRHLEVIVVAVLRRLGAEQAAILRLRQRRIPVPERRGEIDRAREPDLGHSTSAGDSLQVFGKTEGLASLAAERPRTPDAGG